MTDAAKYLRWSLLAIFLNIFIEDNYVSAHGLDKFAKHLEKPATRQLVMVGMEFGLPFDMANTLNNPVGRTLTAASIVGLSIFLALGVVLVPYNMIMDVLDPEGLFPGPALKSGRRKRSILEESNHIVRDEYFSYENLPQLFDIEDAFSFFGELEESCRNRLICDFHRFLTDVPDLVQRGFRFFSRNLDLGPYRQAAIDGLHRRDCEKLDKQCMKSNMQILSQVFPNLKTGRTSRKQNHN